MSAAVTPPPKVHQKVSVLGEYATVLLTEFVPIVKNLTADDDEASLH